MNEGVSELTTNGKGNGKEDDGEDFIKIKRFFNDVTGLRFPLPRNDLKALEGFNITCPFPFSRKAF